MTAKTLLRTTLLALTGLSLCGCVSSRPVPATAPAYETVARDPRRNTTQAQLDNRRGLSLLSRGKLGDAEAAFASALTADATYGPAHNNLGQVYFAQKQFYKAALEFAAAAQLMPQRPEPQNNLGLIYENVGKLDKAVEAYTRALVLAPDNVDVLGNLCRAKVRRNDHDDALKEQLRQLLMRDTRPAWINWAKERLALLGGGQVQN